MRKPVFIFTLAMMFAMTIGCTAMAANDTTQEKSGDGSANCTVKAVVNSTYSVSLPATLNLSKQENGNFKGEYAVGGKGNIANNQYVLIQPTTDSFTMTGTNNGGSATASVSQTIRKWTGYNASSDNEIAIGTDSYAIASGSVEVTLPAQADEYKGNFTFTYSLVTN